MPYVFAKLIKCILNDVDIWEISEIFLKLLRYLGHSSSILKRYKYVANKLKVLNMA